MYTLRWWITMICHAYLCGVATGVGLWFEGAKKGDWTRPDRNDVSCTIMTMTSEQIELALVTQLAPSTLNK